MDKIYIIKVHAGNYEEYEDHFEWDFNYKAFSAKEKAEIWLANVENYIEDVYKYDQYDLFDYGSESPISFERVGNSSKNCIYDIWLGNDKSDDVDRWDKNFYQFIIEELEVE